MPHPLRPLVAGAFLVGAAALALSPSAQAAGRDSAAQPADQTAVTYQMNEGPNASVMHDSGPLGLDGGIGSEVQTGVVKAGETGYRFPWLHPNQPPAHPQHLVSVPDAPALDPGTGKYAIEIRYSTTHGFGNLIQKGQARTRGGQIKIQLPNGRPQCYFKGSVRRLGTGWRQRIDDGQWHTLRCVLTDQAVNLYVDGVRRGHHRGDPGRIDNGLALTIGGKPNCDQVTVTCDYFVGHVAYVLISKG